MDTPKRHHLTIHQKLKIIEESKKPGFKRKDACEKYRISNSSLSRLLKSQANKLQASKNTKGKVVKIMSLRWNFMNGWFP